MTKPSLSSPVSSLPRPVAATVIAVASMIIVGSPCVAEDAIDFGWGEVLAADASTVRRHVEIASGLELGDLLDETSIGCPGDLDGDGRVAGADLGLLLAGWGDVAGDSSADLDGDGRVAGGDLGLLLAAWGDCPPSGEGFTFATPDGGRLRALVTADSRFDVDGIEVRAIDLVGATWDETFGRIHVTRPSDTSMDIGVHRAVLAELGRPEPGLGKFGVAYGISRTDIPTGSTTTSTGTVDFIAGPEAHSNHRTLVRLELDGVNRDYVEDTLWPADEPGVGVAVFETDEYDVPGIDFDRDVMQLTWNAAINGYPWVGFVARLAEDFSPVDLSGPETMLSFTVAGGVQGPDDAPYLYVVLEDVHDDGDGLGNEAHLPIDIGEINGREQRVTIPLARFQAANPALDLSNLIHLKFAARDDNIEGAPYCQSGSVAIIDVEFFRNAPERLTAPNCFWTNDVHRSDPAAWNPLSVRFLDQPVSAFKYFHGIFGTNPDEAWNVIGNCGVIRGNGLTPHVTMEFWPDGGGNPLDTMLAGGYDVFLDRLFTGLRDLGGRVEITPFHESNGFWYPWSSNGEPWKVAAGFERMASIRDGVGAHNVALGYCLISMPGNAASLREGIASISRSATDFIGLQGFEQGYGWDTITFNELFAIPADLLPRATARPLMISEFGYNIADPAQYAKGELTTWSLADMLTQRMPHPLSTFHYFNVAKEEEGVWKDFRIIDEASGEFLAEVGPWIDGIRDLAAADGIRTEELGQNAYETGLRRHARTGYRVGGVEGLTMRTPVTRESTVPRPRASAPLAPRR